MSKIGPYTFEEFKQKAAEFHGYPAPGLLLGGYMTAMAQRHLPEGTLFEALVESKKCLPDAVQLLTLCSTGNNWMKVLNLGRYALSLFDKFTGEGVRVHIDVAKLGPYPEIRAWFMKEKPKKEQDTDKLFAELQAAGESILSVAPVRISPRFLGHSHMKAIGVCPHCKEAYPKEDGPLCRGCQGEAPYAVQGGVASAAPASRVVPVEEAVGKTALHDMTQIIPGEFKDAAFSAGQVLGAGDVCRLQQMGRFHVAVAEAEAAVGFTHENEGAETFARRMAGPGIEYSLPPKEGKVNFRATCSGLFTVDTQRLTAFNMTPDVMCATRQDAMPVQAGSETAGTRVIPLYINNTTYAEALSFLDSPLFCVLPFRKAKVGILVTGTEVFQGLIEDRFIPIISAKVEKYEAEVVKAVIAPDDKERIAQAVADIRAAGADLLITTGGLSVDPDDVTRAALTEAGLTDVMYGAPVLPGTMSLVGLLPGKGNLAPERLCGSDVLQPADGAVQVLGVPACALYFKTTLFDVLLPRLLAGRRITRPELARMGEGGFCMNCKTCTWPKCFFVK